MPNPFDQRTPDHAEAVQILNDGYSRDAAGNSVRIDFRVCLGKLLPGSLLPGGFPPP
jgi:hypothetical protein